MTVVGSLIEIESGSEIEFILNAVSILASVSEVGVSTAGNVTINVSVIVDDIGVGVSIGTTKGVMVEIEVGVDVTLTMTSDTFAVESE